MTPGWPMPATPAEWMAYWSGRGLFGCDVTGAAGGFYLLNMFPYPKGSKHVAQARHFYFVDSYARFLRLRGVATLSPFGFDAFGLPAEHEARTRGIDASAWTCENIQLFRDSYAAWCVGYEADRELITCEPEYYRWTQWLFLLLLEHGIAYRAQAAVHWCPGCETVLANEQVADDRCAVCSSVITQRTMRQWFLRITDYADRLVAGLDRLDWPEHVKRMQRNWIGPAGQRRLRDWLVSRQRQWGTPVPVIHCPACGPVAAAQLPVPPLPDGPMEAVPCPQCGTDAQRDPDTLDTFVDSSWYFLRFLGPHDSSRLVDPDLAARWLPVDMYVGSVSYATSHLLYARFITKVLHDLGLISVDEPFRRLFAFGTILAEGTHCRRDGWVGPPAVPGGPCPACGGTVERRMTKMATRRHNNVDVSALADPGEPDPVRVGVLALGPHDQDLVWSVSGIEGGRRWIARLRRLACQVTGGEGQAAPDLIAARDRCVAEVTRQMATLRMHLAVSHLITFTNALVSCHPSDRVGLRPVLSDLAVMVAPLAPVTAEQMWRSLGHGGSVFEARWPDGSNRCTSR